MPHELAQKTLGKQSLENVADGRVGSGCRVASTTVSELVRISQN